MKLYPLSCGLLLTTLASLAHGDEGCQKTVVFPITLTWQKGSPDGFERNMIFINGKFPGPPLNVEEGDNVEFIVNNQLPWKTSVHFHGIEQLNTPWSDGVPGLTQNAIEPGCTFVYKWKANQYGTYWYHGHRQGQLEDGLFGAINIKPMKNTTTPFSKISNHTKTLAQLEAAMEDPEIVFLSDWSHFTSEELRNISLAANVDPVCGDSILINGKGAVNCPGVPFIMSLLPPPILSLLKGQNFTDKGCFPVTSPVIQTNYPKNLDAVPPGLFSGCNATLSELATIKVDAKTGWVSLNMISTSSVAEMVVSIDDHAMWLYAIDGRFVEPQMVDAMTLSQGSRHSVMVHLKMPAQDYTIRVSGDGLNQKLSGSATLSYKGGKKIVVPNPSIDYSGVNTTANVSFLDDKSVVPFPPVRPAKTADQTFKLLMNRTGAAWQWSLNDDAFYSQSLEDISPLLWNPIQSTATGLTITTKNNTWVDLIFLVTITGGIQPPHPIHKHSNKAHIIGYGVGEFNYTDVAEAMQYIPQNFNLENPPYRDTFYTIPAVTESTWMVVRYHVNNPGPFLLHCHINPHLTGGMAVAMLDGIDRWPKVPLEYGPGTNTKCK